jgi:hypothetical protein
MKPDPTNPLRKRERVLATFLTILGVGCITIFLTMLRGFPLPLLAMLVAMEAGMLVILYLAIVKTWRRQERR